MNGTPVAVHFVVPDGVDDDDRVSGGNVYDRRIGEALRAHGFEVRMRPVQVGDAFALGRVLDELPGGALVLVDGLVAVAGSSGLARGSVGHRIVVVAHLVASASASPADLGRTERREREAMGAARHVIATSEWTRSELVARGLADPARISVAHPGADVTSDSDAPDGRDAPPDPAARASTGLRLLCVDAVALHKGQDVLVEALAGLADVPELPDWTCSIVGSLAADPGFAAQTAAAISAAGLADRVVLTGVLTGRPLADAYAVAGLVVAPSRAESYGMVVADALAFGIPVVAAEVGGIREAIDAREAGILVPPDDPAALRAALRDWLADAGRRTSLAAAARRDRSRSRTWGETAAIIAGVLREVTDESNDRRRAG